MPTSPLAGLATPALASPQLQPFQTPQQPKALQILQGLEGLSQKVAAGFADSPRVRAYQQARIDQDQQQQQAQRQEWGKILLEDLNNMLPAAQQAYAKTGTLSPALQKTIDESFGLLSQIAPDPAMAEAARNRYYQMAQMAPAGGDPFTLSPGQQRFDAAGNPIADLPAGPELRSVGPGEILGQVSEGQFNPLFAGPPKGPETVVNLPPLETEFEKYLGKAQGEEAGKVLGASTRAYQTLDKVRVVEQALSQVEEAGGTTGQLAGLTQQAAATLQSVGVDPAGLGLPASAGPYEFLDAALNRLTTEFIGAEQGGLPANLFTEADRKFIEEIAGRKSNRPEAIRAKMEVFSRASQKAIEAAQEFQNKYPQSAQGWRDFNKDWAQKSLNRNVFKDIRSFNFGGTDEPVSGLPQIGDVVDGFRFKGGDPAQQSNWEPVR